MLSEAGPVLNLQVEQRLNLGNFESLTVSIGVTRLPFDAPNALIDEALDTADRAVERIRFRIRDRIASIRMEGRFAPPVPAFAPDVDEESPFDGPYVAPEPPLPNTVVEAIDWSAYGRAVSRLRAVGYSVTETHLGGYTVHDGHDALIEGLSFSELCAYADEHGFGVNDEPNRRCRHCERDRRDDQEAWPEFDVCPRCAMQTAAPARREIPDEDDVIVDVEVLGVRLPLVDDDGWRRPLTGQVDNTDQMLALNAGLTSIGHGGSGRHRAVEAIANGYLRAFGENAPAEELLLTTLRGVPFAAAHLVLTWLDRADAAALSRLRDAVSRLQGQPGFDLVTQ